jgi:hypothetical protein
MLHRRRSTDQACFDNRSMLADFFYDMLGTPANIGGRHLLHLVVCMGLLIHRDGSDFLMAQSRKSTEQTKNTRRKHHRVSTVFTVNVQIPTQIALPRKSLSTSMTTIRLLTYKQKSKEFLTVFVFA